MMLAVIAGRGDLPKAVVDSLSEAPLICSLSGNEPTGLKPELLFRLEHLGTLINTLKKRGITKVCFCGAVTRPEIDLAMIDEDTLPLVPNLQRALQPGDNAALQAIISVFEDHKMSVKGAHEIAPQLLPPSGNLTQAAPRQERSREITLARTVLSEMSQQDEGQACVLRYDQILAREDKRGTDAMLEDLSVITSQSLFKQKSSDPLNWALDGIDDVLGAAADWLSGPSLPNTTTRGAGGVLYKAPKLGQDRRADLPTIGPNTVKNVEKAHLKGMILDTKGVMVLNLEKVIELCDQSGIFLQVKAIH